MSWRPGAATVPVSIDEWLEHLQRQVNTVSAAGRGLGRGPWTDGVLGPSVGEDGAGLFGWRLANDGRVELRGRLRKGRAAADGSWTDTAWVSGDVLGYLPWVCAPPFNEQRSTGVCMVAPCTVQGGPGVVRVDVSAGAWGGSREGTDAVLRVFLPQGQGFAGWIGLDQVVYDPRLYLDAFPVVPAGEEPLVPDPGVAVMQQPDGSVVQFSPGVEFPGG